MTEEKSVIATTASNIVFEVITRFCAGETHETIDAAVEAHLVKLVEVECATATPASISTGNSYGILTAIIQ